MTSRNETNKTPKQTSPKSSSQPLINPNYLSIDLDIKIQIAIGKFVRKLYSTPPLSKMTISELVPGLQTLPLNATDEQWIAVYKATGSTDWHGTSTAAMRKKEFGGVLDEELVVHGTGNLRVVDASAVPFEVNGHPTSTIYAMAEKLSDLIKERWAGGRRRGGD